MTNSIKSKNFYLTVSLVCTFLSFVSVVPAIVLVKPEYFIATLVLVIVSIGTFALSK